MKSAQTYLIVLFSITTVAGAMLAWRQYGELVELRAAAMNGDERADLLRRIEELEKSNRELQDQLAAARGANEMEDLLDAAAGVEVERAASRERNGKRDGERSPRGGDPPGRGSTSPQAVAMRELMSKPEVQAMMNLQLKGAIEARYSALFKNLNLPVEQIDKLKTLLAERSTTVQDVMAAAREQGLNPRENPEAFRKLIADAQNQINDSIKSVIGDQGFAQLQHYEQTLPQRNVVNQLEQRLSYTNTPLTPAQAEQLVQILAANTPPRQTSQANAQRGNAASPGSPSPGGRGGPPGPVYGRSFDFGFGLSGPGGMPLDGGNRAMAPVTSSAVAQAQTVLAPPQVAALQQIQQQQQTQQQLRQLISETMKANQPARSGGGTKAAPSGGKTRR